jgi:hypothetical protein
MLSPPLSDFEISLAIARDRRPTPVGDVILLSRHNAHISNRFAKATDAVEKNSFFALRRSKFLSL